MYGLSTAVCDLLVCVNVISELGVHVEDAVRVLTDSRGAKLLTTDGASSSRTRHIHRRWFFVEHHIDDGAVQITKIRGALNPANFLTKPVGGQAFKDDRAYAMGLLDSGAAIVLVARNNITVATRAHPAW